jgi:drug/metabolite transporter (DMT)-like permease
MVLLAKFFLHEHVSLWRWLGVALIVTGVGFVAGGPEATPGAHKHHQIETMYGPVGAIGAVADHEVEV